MTSTQTPLKVTQEKLPASQVGLEIEIPGATTQKTYDTVFAKMLRSASIPGFRKGKVPRHVLIQRIGALAIKGAALEELIDSSIKAAILQEKIPVLGNLTLLSNFEDLIANFEPGQPLSIFASADVNPEVTLDNYTGLVVEYEPVEPDPDYVSKILAHHQNERATLLPVEDRPAQAGDVAVVDFSAVLAETQAPIENAQAEDLQLELKEGEFLPELINGIIGMTVSEIKTINVTFPADYFDEELAGKEAIFEVTLQELKEKELPPLDDEFAQEISEFQTLAELEEFLAKRQAQEIEQAIKVNQESALLDALVANMTLELPELLINQECNFLVTQVLSRLKRDGLDVGNNLPEDILKGLKRNARPEAIDQLKRTFALGHVAKQEQITADPETIQQRMADYNAVIKDRRIDQGRLRDVVESELLEELTIKWLLERSELKVAEPQPEPPPPADQATVDVEATPVPSDPEVTASEETAPAKKGPSKRKKANSDPPADS